ncbi:hypothetical protein, partial [Oceanisphaera arctica]|uniref:hypothetical protein n=1 Tax=Oceanisphaera arctica TaxID=641510 RepID=UPI001CA52E49
KKPFTDVKGFFTSAGHTISHGKDRFSERSDFPTVKGGRSTTGKSAAFLVCSRSLCFITPSDKIIEVCASGQQGGFSFRFLSA